MLKAPLCAVFIFALMTPTIAAYAGNPKILEHHNNSSGTTLYSTPEEYARLDAASFNKENDVSFTIEALKPVTDTRTPYIIRVRAVLRTWVFISEGASLKLKVDGKIISISGPGSLRERHFASDAVVLEEAEYPISNQQLKKIGSASNIQFRLIGDNRSITGTFTGDMLENIRLFSEDVPSLIGLSDN